MNSPEPSSQAPALQIYNEHLAGGGGAALFETLCLENPNHASDLRVLEHKRSTFCGQESLGDSGTHLKPGSRVGPFQLIKELGKGGMGVVWRARDLVLRDDVALKFLPQVLSSNPLSLLQLRKEARVLLSLTHKGIVRLRTISSIKGLTFLVQECLEGGNLEALLFERINAGRRGLSAEEAIWVLQGVTPPIAFAHAEGVTHRDLKPSNVMLDRQVQGDIGQGEEMIKVCDFGVAFVANSALTHISGFSPSGTLPYMAPEVLLGQRPSPASDIYSVGVMLYELVSGSPPFNSGHLATQILECAPSPLNSGNKYLDQAVAAALEKDSSDRPKSMQALLAIAEGRQPPALSTQWKRKARLEQGRGSRRIGMRVLLGTLATLGVIALILNTRFGNQTRTDPELDTSQSAAEGTNQNGPSQSPQGGRLAGKFHLTSPPQGLKQPLLVGKDEQGPQIKGTFEGGELKFVMDGREGTIHVRPDGTFNARLFRPTAPMQMVQFMSDGARVATLKILRDLDPPTVTLFRPHEADSTTSAESIEVLIKAIDPHLQGVYLNQKPMESLPLDNWQITDHPLAPGDNELTIIARDELNNETKLVLKVLRYTNGPGLVSCSPPLGSNIACGSEVQLNMEFDMPVTALTLNGETQSQSGLKLGVTITAPNLQGNWSIPWVAKDATSGERTGELHFKVTITARPVTVAKTAFTIPPDSTAGWNKWPTRASDPRTGIVFQLINPGPFRRGTDQGRFDEAPRHEVRLSKPYYLGKTEVTRGQWQRFVEASGHKTQAEMGTPAITRRPGQLHRQQSSTANWRRPWPGLEVELTPEQPVTQIAFLDAVAFCQHYGYRLPTEAEWEKAARAGEQTDLPASRAAALGQPYGNLGGQLSSNLNPDKIRRVDLDDEHIFPSKVGQYPPNANGLHDMLGNVWEWCSDEYDPTAYNEFRTSPASNPLKNTSSPDSPRVLRGGSWLTSPIEARYSRRAWDYPRQAADTRGFRVAFTP